MSKKKDFDKYYTPKDVAEYCYNKVISIIGKENITDIIEPSAGAGVFMNFDADIRGYDIVPEDDRVVQADFLELELDYKKGRLFLGNPPYGRCLNLAIKFYKKAVLCGDFIAFILPISQLNTNRVFYEFDLIYSEDLGIREYSGVNLHCVFNIYKRPLLGLNSKPKSSLSDIGIVRQDHKNYESIDFDIRMCYWGNGTAGKILKDGDHYAGEYKILIHNQEHKEEIKNFIENYDWNGFLKGISMKRLKQFHIIDVLKNEFDFLN